MDPAFTWHGKIPQMISVGKRDRTKNFAHRDQVAAEIDDFAKCIINDTEPEPSGQEGLIDVKIIDAIRTSYHTQPTVKIEGLPSSDRRPQPSQSIRKKPPRETKTVKVSPTSKKS